MKELIIPTDFETAFPTVVQGLKKAQTIFDSIESFEDIERIFLKGNGLAPETYKSYLQAIKQLYNFTDGLNPLQVKPAHIESFYDDLVKKVGRNTACLRIAGLKKFFKGIRGIIPIYTSPFELMPEKLLKKLGRKKTGNRTKPALTKKEANNLKAWLSADKTERGLEDYAMVFMLLTSGLRADELLQLRWRDVEESEGTLTAYFVGKGGRESEQELYGPAVEAVREYFKKAFNRDPRKEENLFYTVCNFNGKGKRPINYPVLYQRITGLAKRAKAEGIIIRNIKISPHCFRRTYATLLIKSGMSLKAVQLKTRHADISTLAKHYVDDSEPAKEYMEKIYA